MTTLLMVEPDLQSVEQLLHALTERDWRCVHRTSFDVAWQTIQSAPPDIIVAEVDLPGGDGFELCRRVRSAPRLAAIPFVFLTSRIDPEDRIRGFQQGADAHIIKPFLAEEAVLQLAAVVRRLSAPTQPSDTDPVTGLLSRQAVLARIDQETERFRRYNRPFALALLAIDRLEALCQARGAEARDIVLRVVAEAIKANLRACDSIGSYGDGFAVLLPEQANASATAAMRRVQLAVEALPIDLPGGPVRVLPRWSIATFEGEDIIHRDRLVAIAETALAAQTRASS